MDRLIEGYEAILGNYSGGPWQIPGKLISVVILKVSLARRPGSARANGDNAPIAVWHSAKACRNAIRSAEATD